MDENIYRCNKCGRQFTNTLDDTGVDPSEWDGKCPKCGSSDLTNLGPEEQDNRIIDNRNFDWARD